MDLKMLLLKSLSSEASIRQHYRVRLGQTYYHIAYVVKGKYLILQHIKRIDPQRLRKHRMQKRKRLLQRLFVQCHSVDIGIGVTMSATSTATAQSEAAASASVSARFSREVQTSCVSMASVASSTESPHRNHRPLIARQQQTMRKRQRQQATQTTCANRTQCAVQTERSLSHCAIQTEIVAPQPPPPPPPPIPAPPQSHCYTTATQTYCDSDCRAVQTDGSAATPFDNLLHYARYEDAQIDQQAVIFMLNEIGEMIINQNHVLHNNTTLLGQVSEMSLLRSSVFKARTLYAHSPTAVHHAKLHRYSAYCRRGQCRRWQRSKPSAATVRSSECALLDAEQQTDTSHAGPTCTAENSSQTNTSWRARRRSGGGGCFSCF